MTSTSGRDSRRKDQYLVWIEIEQYVGEEDEHYPMEGELSFSSTARFDTLEEAIEFANDMHAHYGE